MLSKNQLGVLCVGILTLAMACGGAVVCGDGVAEGAETCDDGNVAAGDGCSDLCVAEEGFMCAGDPSTCASTCGDGVLASDETCDDSNTVSDDGCSALCTPEDGFMCTGVPSTCTSTCGDGALAADEECDDNNVTADDGCSDTCTIETGFDCAGDPSVCTAICGDGVILGSEECDDMNTAAGDGCSDTCIVESGSVCVGEPSVCTCGPFALRIVELNIGTDFIDIQNTGVCTIALGGLNILFDDSSATDLDFVLPAADIVPAQTLRIFEPGGTGDIDTGSNIFFSSSRGGAALLCTGVCATSADVIDVVAFSEGEIHPPLPTGVTFAPSGLTGITDQFAQSYVRTDFVGVTPDLLAADWSIQ